MSALRGPWLVATREIRERARARTFLISTGLIVVLAFGAVAASTVLPDIFEEEPPTVAITPEVPDGVGELLREGSLGTEVNVLFVASAADAQRLLGQGRVDAALTAGPTLAFRHEVRPSIEALTNQAYRTPAPPSPE